MSHTGRRRRRNRKQRNLKADPIIGTDQTESAASSHRLPRRQRIIESLFNVDAGTSYDDKYFEKISGGEAQHLDISSDILRNIQQMALLCYRKNPRAHSYIEIMIDFIVGDGLIFKAEDERVLELLEEHWTVNDWKKKLKQRLRLFFIVGELVLAPRVKAGSDILRLGGVNPLRIVGAERDFLDDENIKSLYVTNPADMLNPISLGMLNRESFEDFPENKWKSFSAPTKIFYWSTNHISGASRGYPDIGSVLDWMEGLDAFTFTLLERSDIAMNVVWDLMIDGATPKELKDQGKKASSTIAKGGVYAHNDKATLNCVTPELAAFEAKEVFEVLARQVYGGTRFPGLFFGDSSDLTRASATELSIGAARKLVSDQTDVVDDLRLIFDAQIEFSKAVSKRLDGVKDFDYQAVFPKILLKDLVLLSKTLQSVTETLAAAEAQGYISTEKSAKIFNDLLKELTVESATEDSTPEEDVTGEEQPSDDDNIDLGNAVADYRKKLRALKRSRKDEQSQAV